MPKKGHEIVFSDVNDPKRDLYRNYVIALSDGEPDRDPNAPRSNALDRILSRYGIVEKEEVSSKSGEQILSYGENTDICYLDGDTLKPYSDLKAPTHENLRQSLREGMILFFPEQDGMPRSLSCLRIGDEEYYQCMDVHQATRLYGERESVGLNLVPPEEPDLLAIICDKFAMFFLGRHGAVMSQWLAYHSLDRAKTAFEEVEPLQNAIHDADAEREVEAERKRQREEEQERKRREEEDTQRRLEQEERDRQERELRQLKEREEFLKHQKQKEDAKLLGEKNPLNREERALDDRVEEQLYREKIIQKAQDEINEVAKEHREELKQIQEEEELAEKNDEELVELDKETYKHTNPVTVQRIEKEIVKSEQEFFKARLDPHTEKLLSFAQRRQEVSGSLYKERNDKIDHELPAIMEKDILKKHEKVSELKNRQAQLFFADKTDPELNKEIEDLTKELEWHATNRLDYFAKKYSKPLMAHYDALIDEATSEIDEEEREYLESYQKDPNAYALTEDEKANRREKAHQIKENFYEGYEKNRQRINHVERIEQLEKQQAEIAKHQIARRAVVEEELRKEAAAALALRREYRKREPEEFAEMARIKAENPESWKAFAKEYNLDPNKPGDTTELPDPYAANENPTKAKAKSASH